MTLRSEKNPDNWKQVQERLDYEIPHCLEKLRKEMNACADPSFNIQKDSAKDKETYMDLHLDAAARRE